MTIVTVRCSPFDCLNEKETDYLTEAPMDRLCFSDSPGEVQVRVLLTLFRGANVPVCQESSGHTGSV